MLLLLAASCDQPATDASRTDPCTSELRVSVDRDRGYLPLSVRLTAEASCLDGEPSWDFGEGSLVQGHEVEHVFLATGSHEVSVSLGDEVATTTVEVWPAPCPVQLEPRQVGTVQDPELDEASGLFHSPEGVLWTHNDSGDAPRLFALSEDGETLAVVALDGAEDGDWEDSSGFVDRQGGSWIVVGDVGDNSASRDFIELHVLAEPALDAEAVSLWTRLELDYPEGPRNADTVMVDPVTQAVLVISDGGELYRYGGAFEDGSRSTLERLGDLPIEATGGDISLLGDRIVVRDGERALLYLRDGGEPLEAAFESEPCELELPEEVQGEAIAFDRDGLGLFTVSEGLDQPIWYLGFEPVEQPCMELEARILRGPDGGIPLSVDFAVDEDCVPAGLAQAVWTFEDGEVFGAATQRTWLAAGSYEVGLTVTDQQGAVSSTSTTVLVEPAECPVPEEPVELADVDLEALPEASGLALSQAHPDSLWTHNDSGGEPELLRIGLDGALEETVLLEVSSRDWEDLAQGWTEAGWTLFVGDVGDNAEKREDIRILLVPEEDPHAYGIMVLTYPELEPHNCESIAVDPQSGDLLVITKDYAGDTSVFRKPAPHLDGDEVELEWVADLDTSSLPFVGNAATTAADFSPLGDLLAVRTYSHVWLFRRDADEDWATTLAREPCDGGAPAEDQGEAVAFTADGGGYLLLSEGVDEPLNYVELGR